MLNFELLLLKTNIYQNQRWENEDRSSYHALTLGGWADQENEGPEDRMEVVITE